MAEQSKTLCSGFWLMLYDLIAIEGIKNFLCIECCEG